MSESEWDETVVLDEVHLASFTGGDKSFQSYVLGIFTENAPTYLELLKASDSDTWKSSAHKLKGAARSIGAWRLARAAERAEHMPAPQVGDAKRQTILQTIESRLEALIVQIQSLSSC